MELLSNFEQFADLEDFDIYIRCVDSALGGDQPATLLLAQLGQEEKTPIAEGTLAEMQKLARLLFVIINSDSESQNHTHLMFVPLDSDSESGVN